MTSRYHIQQKGFTVLIAILVAAIVLAIGLSILGVVLKQLSLAGIARESEMAFHASNAGVECARYYDISETGGDTFDVPGDGTFRNGPVSITCMGITSQNSLDDGKVQSRREQRYEFSWGSVGEERCTKIKLWKFYKISGPETPAIVDGVHVFGVGGCPQGVECTVIKSQGYNAACNALSGDTIVERELTVIY